MAGSVEGLLRLIPKGEIVGRSLIDIGCGSGIHSVAAAKLGAAQIYAIDFDPRSVAAARTLLEKHVPNAEWRVESRDVFGLEPTSDGRFDVVYSWGVLHHTGDVNTALERAAAMTAEGGLFVFSLYRPTTLDWFWIREKRWYAQASRPAQKVALWLYVALFRLASWVTGRRGSIDQRGMEFRHDVNDWLGGYPYEAVSARDVRRIMSQLGFEEVKAIVKPGGFGLFGSGCDEYVFRRA
ncbi:MAG: methyltransferase domain-containing protein [Methyloligellaceae bacterium]